MLAKTEIAAEREVSTIDGQPTYRNGRSRTSRINLQQGRVRSVLERIHKAPNHSEILHFIAVCQTICDTRQGHIADIKTVEVSIKEFVGNGVNRRTPHCGGFNA